MIMNIDLSNFNIAPLMIDFIIDMNLLSDLRLKRSSENLSIAEYIEKYQAKEFEIWYLKNK